MERCRSALFLRESRDGKLGSSATLKDCKKLGGESDGLDVKDWVGFLALAFLVTNRGILKESSSR